MLSMTDGQRGAMRAMMTYPSVFYPQRVRYFFHTSKEQLDGRSKTLLVNRLDKVMDIALVQAEEWHSRLKTVIAEAVELGALHRADHDFFLAQLIHCVPGRYETLPARPRRRIGE